ncbi:MAG TPA: hypothetical protein PLT74_05140 [Kiritimatiellia bacterium]|nr:hypothetical protein [Kiritimatiellia bacterium]
MTFYPLIPLWMLLLLLTLAAVATVTAFRHRNPAVAAWQHRLLVALRVASLTLAFLMLLCPGQTTEERNLEKSHLVFLLDRSASMGTRDLPHGEQRLARAAAFLRDTPLRRLADYPRALYAFNHRTERFEKPDALTHLPPEGGTDLRQAVDRVDKDIGLARVSALVLVSDGIDHSAFKGSDLTLPILSVQVGTDLAEVQDLGIESFACPDTLSEGETLTLAVPLLLNGYPTEQRVAFRVLADDVPIHTATLTLASGRLHTETVTATFTTTGIHTLRVECDAVPGEVTLLNNRRERALEVVTARHELAAYFPLLNNSFRPLLREFTKDESSTFTAVYRVSEGTFRLQGRKPAPVFQNGLPTRAEALKNVTGLILGAHNGDLLSPAEALVLEQYVNQGGSLICLAGSDSFGRLPPGSPLLRLLPVVTLENSLTEGAFRVVPDPDARGALADQVRAIIADNGDTAAFTLSGINLVKDVKAGARVELWADGPSRQPLLVWQPYGRGKVIALLSNAFHLWGLPARREENYGRFWRQLSAFASRAADEADLLTVTVDKRELAAGEGVTVSARARHPDGHDAALSVKADLFAAGRDVPELSRTLDRRTGHFSTDVPGQKPGQYVLRVTSQDGETVLRTRYVLLRVEDVQSEHTVLRSERERFLGFSSERHVFSPTDAAALEERLVDAVRKNVIQRERFLIYETSLFFLALVALLLTEWVLRRRFNLF